jgi:hypothetical protein
LPLSGALGIQESLVKRIALGVFFAPLLIAIIWTIPYWEHSALNFWALFNIISAYVVFLFFAGICHLILKAYGWKKWWQYTLVMFLISFLLNVIFSIYSVAGFDRLFYSQTLVVEFGQITNAGYLLKLRESIISSLIISVAMVLFWFIAVHERNDSVKNA